MEIAYPCLPLNSNETLTTASGAIKQRAPFVAMSFKACASAFCLAWSSGQTEHEAGMWRGVRTLNALSSSLSSVFSFFGACSAFQLLIMRASCGPYLQRLQFPTLTAAHGRKM